jgi:hypothetical protein
MRWSPPRSLLGAAALSFLVVTASACDGGGSQPPLSYCNASSDCPSSMVCEFAIGTSDGVCGGQGECAVLPSAGCVTQAACTCGGLGVSACVVAGYSVASPVRSLGACGEVLDSGASDASAAVD